MNVAKVLLHEKALTLLQRLSPQRTASPHPTPPLILFQAYSVHIARFFTSIIHELHHRGVDMGLQIVRHPHFSPDETRALRRFAEEELSIPPGRILTYPESPSRRIDVLVCADVYARFPRNTRRTCRIFHGPMLLQRNFKRFPFRKTVYQFDKAIVSGAYDLRLMEQQNRGRHNGFEAVVGGFPFLDILTAPTVSKEEYYRKLGLDPNKPTILIGPNWEGLKLARNHGASYFEEIVNAVTSNKLNLLAKLHTCSYNPLMSGGVDWRDKLNSMASRGLLRVDPDPDDRQALLYCDILITDKSSRAFIFMLRGKPVIQYFPAEGPWDRWEELRLEQIRNGSLVAKRAADIPRLIGRVMRGEYHQLSAERVASDCIKHFGQATTVVSNLLLKWLHD